MRNCAIRLTFYTLCVLLFTACTDKGGLMPTSVGKPYEVVIVGKNKTMVAEIMKYLQQPMEGLPQPEPMFDVSFCPQELFNNAHQLSRNIVIMDIDKKKYQQVAIRYEHDKFASPQLILHVQAPDKEKLDSTLWNKRGAQQITKLLLAHEQTIQRQLINQHRNTEMEQMILRKFDINIIIPADMNASKTSEDFLWCTRNDGNDYHSICIFKGTETDSILQANVKGDTDDMYMVLRKDSTSVQRGLWEMKGDAMGGPYVMRTINRQQSPITLLAFVYAPGHKKRNIIRRLETIIQTAETKEETK